MEFFEQALAFRTVGGNGALHVVVVIERGEGGSLADAGYIERSTKLVHFGNEGGMANAITDAESREAVDLGKSAERKDVVVLAEES